MTTQDRIPAHLAPATDLRRRRVRELSESIVDASRWCLPEDRALLQAMFRDGLSAADLAAMRRESPRILRARVKRLVDRVLSPRFAFVVARRDAWPPSTRRVATAAILQGRTLRDTAKHLQLSIHAVRRQMERIDALYELTISTRRVTA